MELLKGLKLTFPIVGNFTFTDHFGTPRPYVAWGLSYTHEGFDAVALPVGRVARARAVFDGAVSGVGYDPEFMGGWVEMMHNWQGAPFWTRFHHLRQTPLEAGAGLHAGDEVGTIGDTGFTTGTHLHFMMLIEERGKRRAIDPVPFFDQRVIGIAIKTNWARG